MKITRELLRLWGAGYEDEKIATLVPEGGLTPLEIAALDVHVEDRLRVLLREEVIPARDLRLLACGWAEGACRAAGWDDQRSLEAIAVARRCAVGEATEAELAAARSAAWEARSEAWSTSRSAWASASSCAEAAAEASSSAWASASSCAEKAAEWAVRSAVWSWASAEAATRAEQLADVVRWLKRIDEAENAENAGKEAE